MHTSKFSKVFVPVLLVTGGLCYSAFGVADGLAAGGGSPQQSARSRQGSTDLPPKSATRIV